MSPARKRAEQQPASATVQTIPPDPLAGSAIAADLEAAPVAGWIDRRTQPHRHLLHVATDETRSRALRCASAGVVSPQVAVPEPLENCAADRPQSWKKCLPVRLPSGLPRQARPVTRQAQQLPRRTFRRPGAPCREVRTATNLHR